MLNNFVNFLGTVFEMLTKSVKNLGAVIFFGQKLLMPLR